MKHKIASLACILAVFFGGCASEPQPVAPQFVTANYGTPPVDHDKIVRDYLHDTMLDPSSLMLEGMGTPYKAYDTIDNVFGYGVDFRYNGKNQFGGYTGWKQSIAFIRDNKVVAIINEVNVGGGTVSVLYMVKKAPAEVTP